MLNGKKTGLSLTAPAAQDQGSGTFSGALVAAEAWVFDLDNTLYPAACNLFDQVDQRICEFIATHLGIEPGEAHRIQKQYFRDYGTSLRGLMMNHALDPRLYLDFVHEIDVTPIPPNPALDQALARLPGRKVIFTNGSTRHAENVMARLGVAHHFEAVFDIVAADYVPKPEPFIYDVMVRRHWIDPRRAVMVEDLPKNLLPAHAMGMTTVLVRTGSDWAQDGADGAHIHHVTDDLAAWLAGVCGDAG